MLNTCGAYLMWRPMVYHACIAPPSYLTCALFAPTFRGRFGIWGRRVVSLYFGVGLGLMRSAVAASSERAYEGHFGEWADFRVRCGSPVFSTIAVTVCSTCGSYSSTLHRPLPLRNCGLRPSRVPCRRSSFSIVFRVVSNLTPPTPSSRVPLKVLLVRAPTRVTKQRYVGPFRGPCCWRARR